MLKEPASQRFYSSALAPRAKGSISLILVARGEWVVDEPSAGKLLQTSHLALVSHHLSVYSRRSLSCLPRSETPMLRKLLFLAVLVQIGQSHLDKETIESSSKGSDTRSDGKVTMERSVLETTPPRTL
jgi:hypothetical protein